MAIDEVLGPRKTMLVLVIVVGCFAVLWPRILSPLIVGHTQEQLKPNKFDREAAVKQERPVRSVGPHPALRERGRAIPPGVPPPSRQQMPPHVRVRSPLSVYFELEPPPIPGMRPPLGSPGGPVTAPKSSMGFVMPIYTICIIVFFVYTLSKIIFKRTAIPYDPVTPDPQFRRRVFRDNSRTSPDKLVVSAISGLVAEVQQQMEASQQRQESQDSQTRPYTNGTILLNTGPVQIVTSEYQEPKKQTDSPQCKQNLSEYAISTAIEEKQSKENDMVENESGKNDLVLENLKESNTVKSTEDFLKEEREVATKDGPSTPELLAEALKEDSPKNEIEDNEGSAVKVLGMEVTAHPVDGSTWVGERPIAPPKPPQEHQAEEVKSIFLETEIPQQSRVLITDFEDRTHTQKPTKNAPLVVSGKMTLSLIQDAPRDTPERDLESTLDEFTTASAMTQPAEKEEFSDEELEEELEVEEIEEELSDEDVDEKTKEK